MSYIGNAGLHDQKIAQGEQKERQADDLSLGTMCRDNRHIRMKSYLTYKPTKVVGRLAMPQHSIFAKQKVVNSELFQLSPCAKNQLPNFHYCGTAEFN